MKIPLFNCFIEADGVDLTDHFASVLVNMSSEEIDTTTYADDNKRRAAGVGDDSFELTVHHDFDPGSVDEVLWPLHAAGSDFLVRVRASSDPVSASNPEFVGTCILLQYSPLAGDAGELSQTQITLPAQGTRIERVTA